MTELSRDAGLVLIVDLIASGVVQRGSASGRIRGQQPPEPEQLTLRVVQVKGEQVLQVVARTGHLVHTTNTPLADPAALRDTADQLTGQPYATWALHTPGETIQVRFTRKDKAFVGRQPAAAAAPAEHDRRKQHLIAPDDPLFAVLGAGAGGDKRRQVDAFLRELDTSVRTATTRGILRDDAPLTVVDLGCGNAYLTFAAHRFLAERHPGTTTIGVELRAELVARSRERAHTADLPGLEFRHGAIDTAHEVLEGIRPDVVLALHACDTATDDALGQAVRWNAPVILAAPCCHHDVQRQLKQNWQGSPGPGAYPELTRHPILRERFADVLTDTLRAGLLRQAGWSTTVTEFIDSRHTPRNAMIRAIRRDGPSPQVPEVGQLQQEWRVTSALTRWLAQS